MKSAHYSTDICYHVEFPSVYVKWNKYIQVPFNQLSVRPRLTPLLRKMHKREICHRNVIPVERISNNGKCVTFQFVQHPSNTTWSSWQVRKPKCAPSLTHHARRKKRAGGIKSANKRYSICTHKRVFLFSNDLLSASTQHLHLETRTVRMVPKECTQLEALTRDANGPIGRTTC